MSWVDGKSETEGLWGWYHSMTQRKSPGSARDDVLLVHMSGCAAGLTVGVRTSAAAVVIPLQEQHLYENHKKENNKNENERTKQTHLYKNEAFLTPTSEGLDEPVHPHGLAIIFTGCTHRVTSKLKCKKENETITEKKKKTEERTKRT